MKNNKEDHEDKHLTKQTAMEIINDFFADLQNIEGMDPAVAVSIQGLWEEKKLSRDELLTALREARTREANEVYEKD